MIPYRPQEAILLVSGDVTADRGKDLAQKLVDDWSTLSPAPRLVVQALAALGLWAVGIRVAPTGFVPVDIGLTTEELARLDAAFPPGAAAGERYTPEIARWAGR